MGWNTIIRVACWASGHSRYELDRQLQANEQLSFEAIARMQREKLQKLVEHAYATVPYYHQLFQEEKITPKDIQSPQDYAALPVLTKTIIRERGTEAFRSTAFPLARLAETTTSGSTGEPLRFYREHVYEEWRMAGSWRAWRWGGWSPGDKLAWIWREYWAQDPITRFSKRVNWWMTRRWLCNVAEMSEETMGRWVQQLQAFQPSFLHGYPSALARFARYLEADRIALTGIKCVFSNGEMLLPEQRDILERVFKSRVHNVYGSSEVHPIAAECAQGALHLSTDLLVAELGDEPRTAGMKRVILTPLHAYGMPLLRYEVGDLALSEFQSCNCGLPFPALQGVVGRSADLFPLPDGRVVHGQVLISYMRQIPGIERFQFRQRTKDTLELYLAKNQDLRPESLREIERVVNRITAELDIKVRTEYVPEIPLTTSGKFRYTICEVSH